MEELRKKDITCFMQEGAVTGLEMSPVCPVAAPGVEYVLYVPRSLVQEARQIVDDLPIDRELLNVKWTKAADRKRRKLLSVYWALGLIPVLIYLLLFLFKELTR